MSNLDFFRDPSKQEEDFFNDGPPAVKTTAITAPEISTNKIDPFRQGVELTQVKYFDAGIVKIHAGEAGHQLRQSGFGMRHSNITMGPAFLDNDRFDPSGFIDAQYTGDPITEIFTFPIVIGGDGEVETENHDGVIEPLTIRSSVSRRSTDGPFEAHDIKGGLMGGNTDSTLASSQIVQVDYFNGQQEYSEYEDRGYFKPGVSFSNYDDGLHDYNVIPYTAVPATLASLTGNYPASIGAGEYLTFVIGTLRNNNSDLTLHNWQTITVTFAGTEQSIDDVVTAINVASGYVAASSYMGDRIRLTTPQAGWHTMIYIDSTDTTALGFETLVAPTLDLQYITFGSGHWSNDLSAAILPMTGSTDNYISFKQRSSSAGWYYDYGTTPGTDSIAFGGMTY